MGPRKPASNGRVSCVDDTQRDHVDDRDAKYKEVLSPLVAYLRRSVQASSSDSSNHSDLVTAGRILQLSPDKSQVKRARDCEVRIEIDSPHPLIIQLSSARTVL